MSSSPNTIHHSPKRQRSQNENQKRKNVPAFLRNMHTILEVRSRWKEAVGEVEGEQSVRGRDRDEQIDDKKNEQIYSYALLRLDKRPDFSHIISWGQNGMGFFIKDLRTFQQTILPSYFKHKKYSSFVRQLNMYGFHKLRHCASQNFFHHNKFTRDLSLLTQIRRKPQKKKRLQLESIQHIEASANSHNQVGEDEQGEQGDQYQDQIGGSNFKSAMSQQGIASSFGHTKANIGKFVSINNNISSYQTNNNNINHITNNSSLSHLNNVSSPLFRYVKNQQQQPKSQLSIRLSNDTTKINVTSKNKSLKNKKHKKGQISAQMIDNLESDGAHLSMSRDDDDQEHGMSQKVAFQACPSSPVCQQSPIRPIKSPSQLVEKLIRLNSIVRKTQEIIRTNTLSARDRKIHNLSLSLNSNSASANQQLCQQIYSEEGTMLDKLTEALQESLRKMQQLRDDNSHMDHGGSIII